MKRRKRRGRRKRAGNRMGVLSISFIVMILMVCLSIQSRGLKEKLNVYAAQKETLQQQIDSENQRAKEIEDLEEYKKTNKYVEEVAKDKLGLVYEDEIIFKPSNP